MRSSLLLVVSIWLTASTGGTCQDLSFSPEDYAEGFKNWNATMTAHTLKGPLEGSGKCNNDFRSKLPACMQVQPDWCWATAVAEFGHFYNPSKYPESGSDCDGVECSIVTHKMGKDCCSDKNACGTITGSPADIKDAISFITGHSASFVAGPLSQFKLDRILSNGSPVLISIAWANGGGHALTVGGCSDGKYYVHDPMNVKDHYQTLSYEDIATYVPPEQKSASGKWFWTFYTSGSTVPDIPASDANPSMHQVAV